MSSFKIIKRKRKNIEREILNKPDINTISTTVENNKHEEDSALSIGKSKLNESQREVFYEALIKQYGGISLALGFGKTLLSLVIALEQTNISKKPILVVASKTLIESWIFEIQKFFGTSLTYIVLHNSYIKDINNFVLTDDIKIVLTTPEVIAKTFKDEDIANKFVVYDKINEGVFNQHEIKRYLRPTEPFSNIKIGYSILYSLKWGCLIVDEIQKYTKIGSQRCQGMGAISADYRWVTSGTMFDEPTTERLLGYHIVIDHPTFPRTLPRAEEYLKSSDFKGFNETIISRKTNPSFIKPKVNQFIISHEISAEEELLYVSMKETMKNIKKQVDIFKLENQIENARQFSTYLLAIICYLRQSVVCSVLPIANVAIDMTDFQNKSDLSKMLLDEVTKLGLTDWLNNKESAKSSRMKKALEVIDNHKNDNLVVFTCFRTILLIFQSYLPTDRKVFTISSDMSSAKRANILEQFKTPNPNGLGHILLLTYELGCEGLNLQCANTILLLDFYWNNGKTDQSIGRILRQGQLSAYVNIYLFTSNLAIEKAIFDKHDLKLTIIEELSTGSVKTKINKIKVNDIINIIEKENNVTALQKIHSRKK